MQSAIAWVFAVLAVAVFIFVAGVFWFGRQVERVVFGDGRKFR